MKDLLISGDRSMKIYPIGYSAHAKLIESLMQSDTNVLLIDGRKSPYTSYAAYHKANLDAKYGKRYIWLGSTLGNKNYNNDGPIELVNAKEGIKHLIALLEQGYDIIIMCGCKDYWSCHRKTVVDLLLSRINVHVVFPEDIIVFPNIKKNICIVCKAVATEHSPSGTGYCDQHYQCSRGHRPDWVQWRTFWVCRCAIEREGTKKEKQMSLFGDGEVKIKNLT